MWSILYSTVVNSVIWKMLLRNMPLYNMPLNTLTSEARVPQIKSMRGPRTQPRWGVWGGEAAHHIFFSHPNWDPKMPRPLGREPSRYGNSSWELYHFPPMTSVLSHPEHTTTAMQKFSWLFSTACIINRIPLKDIGGATSASFYHFIFGRYCWFILIMSAIIV